jgi:nucleotidyltransferase/DNA polymerase involved in DNA repair
MANTDNLYLHADGDSFFVACEVSVHPELKGKPVIVGGDRGIAVAMSAEAKKLGVTRGMPVFQIKKFFPQVIILSHHFDLYRDIKNRMHQILLSYFTEIEDYSIDECFALVKPYEVRYFGSEQKMMSALKKEVEDKLHVTYSFGLARTKALAKQASKLEKPGGLVMLISKYYELRALKATSIDDIWGIGRRTVPRLVRFGLKTAYDFTKFSLPESFSGPLFVLQKELCGEQVLEVESNVDPRDQRSIQSTATFSPASTNPKIIWRELAENAEHACKNAREIRLLSNKVAFFVKTSEFKYYFDEVSLGAYTSDPGTILNALEPKFPKLLPKGKRIRSTGVILHNLIREENAPMDLFGKQERTLKNTLIEEAADKLREKYGQSTILRASSLKGKKPGRS